MELQVYPYKCTLSSHLFLCCPQRIIRKTEKNREYQNKFKEPNEKYIIYKETQRNNIILLLPDLIDLWYFCLTSVE